MASDADPSGEAEGVESDQVGAVAGPRLLTDLLRSDEGPLWARLRELLPERGVDPATAVLAECFEDDTMLEFGVVVTSEGEVYEFDFVYGRGDIKTQLSTGTIHNWERHTFDWRDRPYRSSVGAALEIVASERANS